MTVETINVGDTVRVHIHSARFTLSENAVVVRIPCATGDSWVLRDADTGAIHYISEGCTISKQAQS